MPRRFLVISCCAVALLALSSCGTPPEYSDEALLGDMNATIEAEAFLFNARLHRDGKPTTFKLEMYQTDTLLGLSGKAYLGKGALKGRLTSDSLEMYFPNSHEYLYEALGGLFGAANCPILLADLQFLRLLVELPDSLPTVPGLDLLSDYQNEGRPSFVISAPGCFWKLELIYQERKRGWRLREFRFDDGERFRLWGEIDRYRQNATVRLKRFAIPIDPKRIRITP